MIVELQNGSLPCMSPGYKSCSPHSSSHQPIHSTILFLAPCFKLSIPDPFILPNINMHFSHILVGFAATVSAVDVYGYRGNDKCDDGNYIVATNANPGVCAVSGSGDVFRSVAIRAIPTDWHINGIGYHGNACDGDIRRVGTSNGSPDICNGGDWYSGAKYEFASKKRRSVVTDESVQKGSAMVFENSVSYDLTGLDDALYTEMVRNPSYVLFG